MPFDSLMGSMEVGDVQVIAAGIGPTEDRKKSVDFSDVYYTGTQCIISRKDNPIKDFEEKQMKLQQMKIQKIQIQKMMTKQKMIHQKL